MEDVYFLVNKKTIYSALLQVNKYLQATWEIRKACQLSISTAFWFRARASAMSPPRHWLQGRMPARGGIA
jgi:hypothetical protein